MAHELHVNIFQMAVALEVSKTTPFLLHHSDYRGVSRLWVQALIPFLEVAQGLWLPWYQLLLLLPLWVGVEWESRARLAAHLGSRTWGYAKLLQPLRSWAVAFLQLRGRGTSV